jgi:hypothetical protein
MSDMDDSHHHPRDHEFDGDGQRDGRRVLIAEFRKHIIFPQTKRKSVRRVTILPVHFQFHSHSDNDQKKNIIVKVTNLLQEAKKKKKKRAKPPPHHL